MVIAIIITIISWLLLMFLSTNLIGFSVRGFVKNPEMEKLRNEGHDFIKNEIANFESKNTHLNVFGLIAILIFIYLLYAIFGFGIALVALILMLLRIPDLLLELKHGAKIEHNLLSKDFKYFAHNIAIWLTLPLLYYFIYITYFS